MSIENVIVDENTITDILSVVKTGNCNKYAKMRIKAAMLTLKFKGKTVNAELLKSLLVEVFEKYPYIQSKENLVTAAVDTWKFESGLHYTPSDDCVSKLSEKRQNQLNEMVGFYYHQTQFIFPEASLKKLLAFKNALSQILADEYIKGKVYDFSKAYDIRDIPLYSKDKFPNELLRKSLIESGLDKFGIIPKESSIGYKKFVF